MDTGTKKINLLNLDFLFLFFLILSVSSIPFLRLELSFKGARYLLSLPVILIIIYVYFKIIETVTVNRKPLLQAHLSLILVSFLFWALISLLWSDYQNWSFLLELTFYVLFTVFIINFCRFRKPVVLKINQLLFYVVFFMVVVGFYRLLTGQSPWFEFTNHYEREVGTRNSDIFMVVTVLPVAFSLLTTQHRKKVKKFFAFLIMFLYFIAIVLSLSRGQTITSILLLVLLSFIYLNLGRVNPKMVISTIMLTFLLIIGSWLLLVNYFSETYELFIQRFNVIGDSKRIEIASFAWDVAKDHPLLGIGLENLKFMMPQKVDAHNAYLNIVAELGIVGLFLFALILFYPAFGYMKLLKQIKSSSDNEDKGIYIQGFGFITVLIISSMFNTFYNFIYFWIIYVMSCCHLIYLNTMNKLPSRR